MAKKARKTIDRHTLFSYGVFGIVVMLLTYLLIAQTPLRRTVPGYPSRETRQVAIENYRKIDSLEKEVRLWAFQVANIQRVVTGRETLSLDSMNFDMPDLTVDPEQQAAYGQSDSLLRAQVEKIDSVQQARPVERIEALKDIAFKRPLKGTLQEGFRPSGSHPYVALTAPAGTQAAAVLDGIIVSAEWSELEGCSLYLRHDHDLTSIYRHASKVLRNVGEQVKAGTPIAVVGETGELSQALIQLEIRYKNQAIDPSLYIEF